MTNDPFGFQLTEDARQEIARIEQFIEAARPWRPDPSAARAARTRNKQLRWIDEMHEHGWSALDGMSYEQLVTLQRAVIQRCDDLGLNK